MSRVTDILTQVRPEVDFSGSADFVAEGLLDSFDLIALVSELDRIYAISIDGLDITPENFASVAAIEDLVRRTGATP